MGILNIVQRTSNGVTTTFTYDLIDQLLSETRQGYFAEYAYDENGNRLTRTVNSVTEVYEYDDADKLLSVSISENPVKEYTYDACGRLIQVTAPGNQITQLQWDYEDRLIGITYPNQSTNSFGYNPFGARVSKTDSSGTSTYFRAGTSVVSPVLSDGSATYTPGISERRDSTSTFYHSDLKNNTSQTNSSQNISGTNQYDAFGNLIDYSGTWSGSFAYGGAFGYQSDDDSGLMLLGHRYYDASTGRFISRDTAQDGHNWYVYAENNPITFADPDGHAILPVIIAIGAAAWKIYDTFTTVKDIIENPKDPWSYAGIVPGGKVAKSIGKAAKQTGKAISNTAKKIANGHARKKHKHQFPGFKTPDDLAKHVDNIIKNPSAKKKLKNGREAYWDEKSGTVVIINSKDPDGGTVFKPDKGKKYFDELD